MADITNPEAVRFSNEKVRILADALESAYRTSKAALTEWYANNMGELFPAADTVVDGSATDGRHPLTGNDVANVINRAAEMVADYEASSNAKLNTVLAVSVNGAPQF